jgi:hypothetical protein
LSHTAENATDLGVLGEVTIAGYHGRGRFMGRAANREPQVSRQGSALMKRSMPFAAMVLVWPSVACASFGGSINLPWGFVLVLAALFALPGAIVVLLLEWIGATRTPPSWLGAVAALPLVYCVLRATGLVRGAEPGHFLLPIPPLIELVLITFITPPRVRHAVGWGAAVASTLLLGLLPPVGPVSGQQHSRDSWVVILGGAFTTALLWQIGVWLGRRSLRRAP